MSTFNIIAYSLFSLLCVALFIFHNWYLGDDLRWGSLFGMVFTAIAPLINIAAAIIVLIMLIKKISTNEYGVLLKGRR